MKKLRDTLTEIDREWQAEGQLRLMFQDEARFGRVSGTRRCWCPKPLRPLCQAMITQEYVYAYAAVSVADGELDTIILVLDGAEWHRSHTLKLPPNLRLLMLPPYSPELNPVENLWDELREKSFHNRIFDSLDALESHLEAALYNMEKNRERVQSIVAWPWIINSLMK